MVPKFYAYFNTTEGSVIVMELLGEGSWTYLKYNANEIVHTKFVTNIAIELVSFELIIESLVFVELIKWTLD